MDISQVIAPDSDEMVAADLIGSPPRVFTIIEVTETARDGGRRVANIMLEGFPRPWRPGKGMSRVMADNWGVETQNWIGRQVELYGDPDVYFGKEKTGGVRISRLSNITATKTTRTNPRSGKNASWTVRPLPAAPQQQPEPTVEEVAACTDIDALKVMWKRSAPERRAQIESRVADLANEPDAPLDVEGGQS